MLFLLRLKRKELSFICRKLFQDSSGNGPHLFFLLKKKACIPFMGFRLVIEQLIINDNSTHFRRLEIVLDVVLRWHSADETKLCESVYSRKGKKALQGDLGRLNQWVKANCVCLMRSGWGNWGCLAGRKRGWRETL